jgi:hypothetical protein
MMICAACHDEIDGDCFKAGVPYGRAAGGLTFHWATRRTGATRMLTRRIDPGTVQKVGRWKTAAVVLRIYHELLDDQAQRAVESVSQKLTSEARAETPQNAPQATALDNRRKGRSREEYAI